MARTLRRARVTSLNAGVPFNDASHFSGFGRIQPASKSECMYDRVSRSSSDFKYNRNAPYAKTGTRAATFGVVDRSEEHTSELQSLMRISYAVFCLKKKNKKKYNKYTKKIRQY